MRTAPLLDEPAVSLRKTSEFFGHTPSQEELARMTHTDIMRRNAKDPRQQYGGDIRREEARKIDAANRAEIDAAIEWINPVIAELGLVDFMRGHAV